MNTKLTYQNLLTPSLHFDTKAVGRTPASLKAEENARLKCPFFEVACTSS